MTRTEKRLLTRTILLGLALTVLVIVADAIGMLDPLERYCYDWRARNFQFFTPRPTEKIVHLDIDDTSLQEDALGRFPWDRTNLAEILDELHLAEAKVIGFDVIFPEPQRTRYEKHKDGAYGEINDDENFAAAMRRADNVLIPFAATFEKPSEMTVSSTATTRQINRLLEFSQPLPTSLPPLLHAERELTTIALVSEAARYSGVVDFLPSSDSVVRSVPLFINHRGRLMPHMTLASACAWLGVPMSQVRVTADEVTIPVRDGPPIVIPVRTMRSTTFGDVGLFMDIPWFGKGGAKNWETMYDYPTHATTKQHIPIRNVWAIRQDIHELNNNREVADDAITTAQSLARSSEAAKFLDTPVANRTWEQREKAIAALLQDLKGIGIAEMATSKPAGLKEEEEALISAYQAMERISKMYSIMQTFRANLRKNVEGRYVLIGFTATAATDNYATSIEPQCPGVMMHGVIFNAIINRDFWTYSSWWTGAFWALVLGSLTTLAVAFLSVYGALICTSFIIAGYALLNGIVFYDYGNHIVAAAPAVTASVLIWFGVTVGRIIYEQRERWRITKRFSRMVDPALVNHFIENPEARFDGQVKEMTVVFTDLAGFTTISEKLRERTVPLLNEYMSLMLPIIRENRGYWNKFLGDGIMFFYNAPIDNYLHARDAVYTVLEMQKAMAPFNQRLLEAGLPQVVMRAGITTGMMVVGDAGSTDAKHHASDYTVLGDEVNFGARLESANKALGSRVLVGERTAKLVESEFLLRPMGLLQVVGKTQGVMSFEALCSRSEATDQQKNLVEASAAIVEHFRAGMFDPCIEAARKMEEAIGSSKFTQLYLRLARRYLIEPPGDEFDGHIVLEEK